MNCPVCQSTNISHLYEKGQRHLSLCRACHSAFQSERESTGEEYYSDQYYSAGERSESQFINWVQQDEIRRKVNVLKRFQPHGRLLDIGCGYGFFLHAAKTAGYEVFGVEPNSYSVRKADELFGLHLSLGNFGQTPLSPPYDIVTAFHVIEHVPKPREFVEGISNSLRPGGLAIIETPNFASRNAKGMKSDWPFILPDEHLTYFTAASLEELLHQNGLDSIYQKQTGPFIHKKSSQLKAASTANRASWKFKLMKRLYYFASEQFRLGDHIFMVARKRT